MKQAYAYYEVSQSGRGPVYVVGSEASTRTQKHIQYGEEVDEKRGPGTWTEEEMKKIQTELIRLKAYDGNVDGLWGPKTEAALMAVYSDCRWLRMTGQRAWMSLNMPRPM